MVIDIIVTFLEPNWIRSWQEKAIFEALFEWVLACQFLEGYCNYWWNLCYPRFVDNSYMTILQQDTLLFGTTKIDFVWARKSCVIISQDLWTSVTDKKNDTANRRQIWQIWSECSLSHMYCNAALNTYSVSINILKQLVYTELMRLNGCQLWAFLKAHCAHRCAAYPVLRAIKKSNNDSNWLYGTSC